MAEWYQAFYGDQYRDSVQGLLTPERTAEEVAFVNWRFTLETARIKPTHLYPIQIR